MGYACCGDVIIPTPAGRINLSFAITWSVSNARAACPTIWAGCACSPGRNAEKGICMVLFLTMLLPFELGLSWGLSCSFLVRWLTRTPRRSVLNGSGNAELKPTITILDAKLEGWSKKTSKRSRFVGKYAAQAIRKATTLKSLEPVLVLAFDRGMKFNKPQSDSVRLFV
jgi:hypothetical protein